MRGVYEISTSPTASGPPAEPAAAFFSGCPPQEPPRRAAEAKSLLLEEKVAEAERSSAKTDEVDTGTNPVRDLNQIYREKGAQQKHFPKILLLRSACRFKQDKTPCAAFMRYPPHPPQAVPRRSQPQHFSQDALRRSPHGEWPIAGKRTPTQARSA